MAVQWLGLLRFHCQGPGLILGQEIKIPQAVSDTTLGIHYKPQSCALLNGEFYSMSIISNKIII